MNLTNRVAVVTGAGGGIGRAIALSLARRGCHLSLCDIDAAAIEDVARQASALGVRCTTHCLDVRDRAAVAELPAQVLAAHGAVHLVVNNAGVALGGNFDQVSEADFDWLMDINFHAVVRMTRAFLPHLRNADQGRIVNISSLWGLMSPPGQTAYSASKFAVRGFSNSLRHELDGSTVGVTVVHPGGVATSIVRSARVPAGIAPQDLEVRRKQAERMLTMPPERAGEIIVKGIERDAVRILVGADAKITSVFERLMPVSYWRVIGALVKRR
jgi:NAD(P)-dependent dehydrogenase (short-subunit alcohol dehydrogenase family)